MLDYLLCEEASDIHPELKVCAAEPDKVKEV
jgi:hypothetical protein